jgi:hypothetical protein
MPYSQCTHIDLNCYDLGHTSKFNDRYGASKVGRRTSHSLAHLLGTSHPTLYSPPQCTSHPNVVSTPMHFLPQCTSYPNALPTLMHFLPQCTSYPNALPTPMHFLPQLYTPQPNVLHRHPKVLYTPKLSAQDFGPYTSHPKISHSSSILHDPVLHTPILYFPPQCTAYPSVLYPKALCPIIPTQHHNSNPITRQHHFEV